LAGGLGFEPRLTESESAVLPLNYPPPGRSRLAGIRGSFAGERHGYKSFPGNGPLLTAARESTRLCAGRSAWLAGVRRAAARAVADHILAAQFLRRGRHRACDLSAVLDSRGSRELAGDRCDTRALTRAERGSNVRAEIQRMATGVSMSRWRSDTSPATALILQA